MGEAGWPRANPRRTGPDGPITQPRIFLWLRRCAEDLGDLSWSRARINRDYWDIRWNINWLTGDEVSRAQTPLSPKLKR